MKIADNPELKSLEGLLRQFMLFATGQLYMLNKQYRLAKIMRAELYLRGAQYLVAIPSPSGQPVSYRPISQEDVGSDIARDGVLSTSCFNHVRSLARKFESVLSARAPNVACEPLVEASDDQNVLATAATRACQGLRKFWDVEKLQKQICFTAWNAGTIFTQVKWKIDGEEYGQYQEGVEGEDGLTMITDVPSGLPEPEILSEINVSIPLNLQKIEEAPWAVVDKDEFVGDLILQYPELDSELTLEATPMWASPTANARRYIASIDGDSNYGFEAKTNVFLTPRCYPLLKGTIDIGGVPMRMGEWLKQAFPRGMRYVFVRDHLVEIEEGVVAHTIGAGVPDISNRVVCDPIVVDFIAVQDATNTQQIIMGELLESALPQTFVNVDKINLDAYQAASKNSANNIVPIEAGGDGDLSKAVYNLPQASIDPRNLSWVQWMLEIGKEFMGILPAIYGGQTGSQTAYEAERRLNQALQQLALAWLGMRQAWTSLYTNALRMLATKGGNALKEFGVTDEDLFNLRRCFSPSGRLVNIKIVVEENIPVMRAQISAMIQEFLRLGPAGEQILGISDPDNAMRIKGAIGLSDWNVPVANQRKWVREQIALLLQQEPVLQPDPMTGEPMPVGPSIQVDPVYAEPEVAFSVLRGWLIGDGQKIKEDNPLGYQNVYLWATGWLQLIISSQQPPPEQAPVGGGEPIDGRI